MPPKTPPPLPNAALVGPRWEYRFFTLGLKAVEDAEQVLTELGDQGWEMTAMIREDSGKVIFAFKRRKRLA
jgi:hypothetical protein